ncbi:MAG: PH domain-containing protein [Bacteroidetes bacterium]|nr:PH domain-containing protein [Bacteroidota bacterium]MCY4204410.1 PH domain-containing protein [Bacteroidota bacterium]
MELLDPAVKRVWTIKGLLGWGILLPVTATVDVILFFLDNSSFLPGLWTGILFVTCLLWVLIIPKLRYRYWRYELRDEDLYAIRGIWNRVQTIVPLRRIQHLDVEQDLIEGNFDIARLVVHTAGTRSTDVVVPGLPYDEAVRLRDTVRDFISQYMD